MVKRYYVGRCLLLSLLEKSGMTQADLADKTGISRSQINAYIKENQGMSLGIAKTIAAALNCHIDDLYEWRIR